MVESGTRIFCDSNVTLMSVVVSKIVFVPASNEVARVCSVSLDRHCLWCLCSL